jgi:hypothetical protein
MIVRAKSEKSPMTQAAYLKLDSPLIKSRQRTMSLLTTLSQAWPIDLFKDNCESSERAPTAVSLGIFPRKFGIFH